MQAAEVVELWYLDFGTCPMCGMERIRTHAVGWWCGPRLEDFGTVMPDGEEVAAMAVCKGCHDDLYYPDGYTRRRPDERPDDQ